MHASIKDKIGRLQRQSYAAKIGLFVALGLVIIIIIVICSRNITFTDDFYNYMTMSLFGLAGVASIIVLSMLFYIIHKYFHKEF